MLGKKEVKKITKYTIGLWKMIGTGRWDGRQVREVHDVLKGTENGGSDVSNWINKQFIGQKKR